MPLKFQSVLFGGLIAAVSGTIVAAINQITGGADPTNSTPILGIIFSVLGCMIMLTSGLFAVWHYTTENEVTLKGSQGVGIGALAGIVYAVVGMLLYLILIAVDILAGPDEIIEMMRETGAFDTAGGEQAESMTRMGMVWGIPIMSFVGGVIMGLIGGAIGAALFKHGTDDEESVEIGE